MNNVSGCCGTVDPHSAKVIAADHIAIGRGRASDRIVARSAGEIDAELRVTQVGRAVHIRSNEVADNGVVRRADATDIKSIAKAIDHQPTNRAARACDSNAIRPRAGAVQFDDRRADEIGLGRPVDDDGLGDNRQSKARLNRRRSATGDVEVNLVGVSSDVSRVVRRRDGFAQRDEAVGTGSRDQVRDRRHVTIGHVTGRVHNHDVRDGSYGRTKLRRVATGICRRRRNNMADRNADSNQRRVDRDVATTIRRDAVAA